VKARNGLNRSQAFSQTLAAFGGVLLPERGGGERGEGVERGVDVWRGVDLPQFGGDRSRGHRPQAVSDQVNVGPPRGSWRL
jgi:hypothetical protein